MTTIWQLYAANCMRNIWQPYDSCIPIDEKYVTTIIQLYLKSKKLICWNRNCGLPKPWSDQSTRWTACRYQGIVSFPQHVIFVIIIFCIFIVIVIIIIVIVICDHHHRYAYLRNHHHCYHHHHSYCRRLERNLIEEIPPFAFRGAPSLRRMWVLIIFIIITVVIIIVAIIIVVFISFWW